MTVSTAISQRSGLVYVYATQSDEHRDIKENILSNDPLQIKGNFASKILRGCGVGEIVT